MKGIVKQLQKMSATADRLERDDFELRNGEPGTRSLIASFKAPKPLVLRRDRPVKVTLVAGEERSTNGSGETQSFELANNVIDAPNTQNVVLYADGQRVKPETVNYDENTIEYADGGEEEQLALYYVPGDPMEFEIEKQAPQSQGSISEPVFDEPLSLLHPRDQNEQPRYFDVGASPLQPVIPEKWRLNVYTEGPYAPAWAEDVTDTTAVNALLSLPYKQGHKSIDGLGRAVSHDIVERL